VRDRRVARPLRKNTDAARQTTRGHHVVDADNAGCARNGYREHVSVGIHRELSGKCSKHRRSAGHLEERNMARLTAAPSTTSNESCAHTRAKATKNRLQILGATNGKVTTCRGRTCRTCRSTGVKLNGRKYGQTSAAPTRHLIAYSQNGSAADCSALYRFLEEDSWVVTQRRGEDYY